MTIIFLNPSNKKLYVCTESEPMKVIDPNNPDILKLIPNDDILYVENGHIIQKEQFAEWLKDGIDETPRAVYRQDFDPGFRFNVQPGQPVPSQPQLSPTQHPNSNRLYIHPVHNGTVLIEDISSSKFPEGIELNGKYHFIAIDEIGEENLNESRHFQLLLAKNKIEIVNENYVMKNQHKHKRQSAADAALDAILVKDSRRGAAHAVARSGLMSSDNEGYDHGGGAIPIYVE